MCAKDGTERALWDCSDFADQIQLIIVQLRANACSELRHHLEWVWCQKPPFISRWDVQQRFTATPAYCPAALLLRCQTVHSNSRLTDKLVGGDPDGYGELQLLAYLTPDSCGDVLGWTEQTAGAGEVEERVTIATRLDGWRVDPENFVQRPRSLRIEPRVREEAR